MGRQLLQAQRPAAPSDAILLRTAVWVWTESAECVTHCSAYGTGLMERWPASGALVLLAVGSISGNGTSKQRHEAGELGYIHNAPLLADRGHQLSPLTVPNGESRSFAVAKASSSGVGTPRAGR
jgi:hypothetical protein